MWSFIWSYTVVYTVGNQCVARLKKKNIHMVSEVIGHDRVPVPAE